jgi:hypothetical protein
MLFSIAVLLSTFPFHGFAEAPVKDTDFFHEKEGDRTNRHVASWFPPGGHELKKGTTLYVWAGDRLRRKLQNLWQGDQNHARAAFRSIVRE